MCNCGLFGLKVNNISLNVIKLKKLQSKILYVTNEIGK